MTMTIVLTGFDPSATLTMMMAIRSGGFALSETLTTMMAISGVEDGESPRCFGNPGEFPVTIMPRPRDSGAVDTEAAMRGRDLRRPNDNNRTFRRPCRPSPSIPVEGCLSWNRNSSRRASRAALLVRRLTCVRDNS